MSLLVAALIAGGGALVAGAAARLVVRRRARKAALAQVLAEASAGPSRLHAAGFEIEQGDVISANGRELWLEQGWLLSEGGEPVAVLMFAREAVVLALPKPRARLYALSEIELALASDPPSALDHGGARYERARRLPIEIAPLDESPDPPWPQALLVEYRGLANQVVWALSHAGTCRAFEGRALDASEVEHWGGGSSTLAR